MSDTPLVVNGWHIYYHSMFQQILNDLIAQVEELKASNPTEYTRKNAYKRLQAILKLVMYSIPKDPNNPECRQGNTLGKKHKHWFRAKFFQQYRLFFRYSQKDKIIVFVWANDEEGKLAYGSKSDALNIKGKT